MMNNLNLYGHLLTYPTTELVTSLSSFRSRLNVGRQCSQKSKIRLGKLIDWMANQELIDLEEHYVALFDQTPSLSLHLFEHIHGDSLERGGALVDLNELYRASGLIPITNETSDYLPLFFEFLSTLEFTEMASHLDNIVDLLSVIEIRLTRRQSPYAYVFAPIIALANRKPDSSIIKSAMLSSDGGKVTLNELDQKWSEPAAFGNLSGLDLNTASKCLKD